MVLSPRPMRQQLAAAATQLRSVGGMRRPQRVHAVVLTALANASAMSITPCTKAKSRIPPQPGQVAVPCHPLDLLANLLGQGCASAVSRACGPNSALPAPAGSRSNVTSFCRNTVYDLAAPRRGRRRRMGRLKRSEIALVHTPTPS